MHYHSIYMQMLSIHIPDLITGIHKKESCGVIANEKPNDTEINNFMSP